MNKKYWPVTRYMPLCCCALVLTLACTPQSVPGTITAKDLLGSWDTIQGSAESITFAEENGKKEVYTYLNARPFETGSWQLTRDGRLLITFDSGEKTEYRASIRNGKDLILRKTNGTIEQYERIFTIAEKLTNWGIELGKQLNLDFGAASPTDFSWQFEAEETPESMTLPIQGYEITASVSARGRPLLYTDKVQAIDAYLDALGFQTDPHNVYETASETMTGKIRYEEIIQLVTSKNPGTGESAPIKIKLGLISSQPKP
jgi:predicted secreted protein